MLKFCRWPKQKHAFQDSGKNTYGGVECLYLNLYDAALPRQGNVNNMKSTKNPESYAWFAIANYMSTIGRAHQDWSTGACREEGDETQTVTVIRGGIPRRTAAPVSSRALLVGHSTLFFAA